MRVKGLLCRWPSIAEWEMHITAQDPRLRNDLYCVEWDIKLYYTIPIINVPAEKAAWTCTYNAKHSPMHYFSLLGEVQWAMLWARPQHRCVHNRPLPFVGTKPIDLEACSKSAKKWHWAMVTMRMTPSNIAWNSAVKFTDLHNMNFCLSAITVSSHWVKYHHCNGQHRQNT